MAPNRGARQSSHAGGGTSTVQRSRRGDGNSRNAAAHIQARQEKRKAAGPRSIHDVFEYATKQLEGQQGSGGRARKRIKSNIMDQGEGRARRDDDDEGDDNDDNDDGKGRIRDYGTAPILSKDGEDSDEEVFGNAIASEDDEDIDSDEALGESDVEPFDDLKYDRQKRAANRRAVRNGNQTQSGEEDEDISDEEAGSQSEGSIDEADLVDLSRVLDGSDGESADEDEEDDQDEEAQHAKLQQHMDTYTQAGKKRSASNDLGDDEAAGSKHTGRRRVLKDRVEAMAESDWNAPALRSSGGQGLTIDDLMRPITDEVGTSMTSIRRAAKVLQSGEDDEEGREAVASKRGGSKLSAPLPTVIQERFDRSAAYQESKEEVEGWQATIKRLREAPHLSFPLQPDPVQRPTTAALAAHHRPTNAFEQNIAALLQREGATEKQMQQAEELKMNERGMSADEIRQRTAELRRMRELLFREEQKAKRVSKIKSKAYRRIARKEKQKELDKAREAGLLDGQDDNDDDEERRIKAERLRAKERATLKHKNAGKWAKSTLNAKGLQDMPEARQAIEEQLLRGEQLRRRIHGQGSDDDSDNDDVGGAIDDSDVSDSDAEGIRKKAFDEMAAAQTRSDEQGEQDAAHGQKGVWNMKFMREARDRKAKATEEQMEAFMRDMQDQSGDEDFEDGHDNDLRGRVMQLENNAGRMIFNATDKKGDMDDAVEDREEVARAIPTAASTIEVRDTRSARPPIKSNMQDGLEDGVNPWLVKAGNSKVSRKNNDASISKEGSSLSKAANRIAKHGAKGKEAQVAREEDGELVIDPNAVIDLQQSRTGKAQQKVEVGRGRDSEENDDESDAEDAEGDVEEVSHRHPNAIRQRKLVAEAFAGDDVLVNFAKEKAAAIDAEAPQEVDNFLVGWGSWGGKGVRKDKRREEERRKRFTKWTTGLDPSKRKDAKMDNVIVNQKQDKKADKYKADDVPFPFTSRAQYEMAMRNPLGPEWNTRTQHQRLTLPRVVTKPGKAIKPIEKMF